MRSYQDIVRSWAAGEALADLKPEQRRAVGLIASGTATDEQLAAAGAEFVVGIKSHLPYEAREAGELTVRADESRANVLTWKYSDEKPDRMGDIIRADGWELENYKRNPVILWGHAAGFDSVADEPIGRSLDVRVEGKALYGDILFDVDDERAARIYRKAKAGFVSAGSVGFRPLKTSHVSDEGERAKLGLGRFGVIFEKAELLEFSLCAIPANPNALQQALAAGTITAADAEELGAGTEKGALRTEKDWENYVRRKARSFVSMAAAPMGDDGSGHTYLFSPLTVRSPSDDALRALAESQQAMARALTASHDQLARAITDLGGCLQTLRSAPATAAKPPEKQAPRAATSIDTQKVLAAINELRREIK